MKIHHDEKSRCIRHLNHHHMESNIYIFISSLISHVHVIISEQQKNKNIENILIIYFFLISSNRCAILKCDYFYSHTYIKKNIYSTGQNKPIWNRHRNDIRG